MTGNELHDTLVIEGFLPHHPKTRPQKINVRLNVRQQSVSWRMRLIQRFKQIFRK